MISPTLLGFVGNLQEGDSTREWVYFTPLQGMTEVTEMDMGCVLGGGSATPHGITDVCFVRVYAGSEAERYDELVTHSTYLRCPRALHDHLLFPLRFSSFR
jgi:hypothetical protein